MNNAYFKMLPLDLSKRKKGLIKKQKNKKKKHFAKLKEKNLEGFGLLLEL